MKSTDNSEKLVETILANVEMMRKNAEEMRIWKNLPIAKETFELIKQVGDDEGPLGRAMGCEMVVEKLAEYNAPRFTLEMLRYELEQLQMSEEKSENLTEEDVLDHIAELERFIDIENVSYEDYRNRINVAFDIYSRKNFDEIGPVVTQGIGGQVIRWANAADMKSSGQELSISTTNIKNKDFSWTTSLVYSHTKTEITNLASQDRVIDLITNMGGRKEGYPVRALFSIPFQGLDENGIPTFTNESGDVTNYDINFQERDNTDYLKYEGPTDPTVQGSFGNLFKWKGFTLNLFITYSFGNVVRLDPAFSAYYSDLSSMTKEFKNRWMVPGDEKYTNVPVILSYRQYQDNSQLRYGYNAYNYSDVRIAKGDFIRMKEISLSYDFPKTWIKPLTNLSLKLQATNLFLIYADKKLNGQDPEFFRSGGVSAPVPKQFTLTVKAGF